MRIGALVIAAGLWIVTGAAGVTADKPWGVYQQPESFLEEVFQGAAPEPSVLWVTGEIDEAIRLTTGHGPSGLRMRYWRKGPRTAWILEEIGKEKPITTGVLVGPHGIERLAVLIFRESRGWEVNSHAFTDQLRGAQLDEDLDLTRRVDGITGATLSVRALKRIAREALVLHRHVMNSGNS